MGGKQKKEKKEGKKEKKEAANKLTIRADKKRKLRDFAGTAEGIFMFSLQKANSYTCTMIINLALKALLFPNNLVVIRLHNGM